METVLMIRGELEHLENLVKLARRKKDVELVSDQVASVSPVPAIRRICVNKTNRSTTLHLQVEIDRYIIKGLVDTRASMSVMAAAMVREMGMMHLVVGSKSYKTASGVVTRALGRIDEVANVHSEIQEKDVIVNTRGTSCGSMEAELEKLSLVGSKDVLEIVTDTDSEDGSTEESQPVSELDGASEFENTEFENLVLEEGPEQILQLTLQDQTDEFMKEEVSDSDDYADWI
ncbi:unnamed protein product [Sphagnum tenellum]